MNATKGDERKTCFQAAACTHANISCLVTLLNSISKPQDMRNIKVKLSLPIYVKMDGERSLN